MRGLGFTFFFAGLRFFAQVFFYSRENRTNSHHLIKLIAHCKRFIPWLNVRWGSYTYFSISPALDGLPLKTTLPANVTEDGSYLHEDNSKCSTIIYKLSSCKSLFCIIHHLLSQDIMHLGYGFVLDTSKLTVSLIDSDVASPTTENLTSLKLHGLTFYHRLIL